MSKTRPTITFELVGPKGERIALRETARHNGWRTDHVVYVPTKPLTPGTYDVRGAGDALALQVVPASDTPLPAPTLKVLPGQSSSSAVALPRTCASRCPATPPSPS